MMAQIIRQLLQVVPSWWRRDRIRISPRAGRILQILPGDLLVIGETRAEVQARTVTSSVDGHTVCLACRKESGEAARLCIAVTTAGKVSDLIWEDPPRQQNLTEDELETWFRNR